MPNDQPRLDRTSLARLGIELKAAHHLSERPPLSERQKNLLLEWAVKEALEAGQQEALAPHQPEDNPDGLPLTLDPPRPPQPIATAPKAANESDPPVVLLLYSPRQGGWHTGFWSAGRWRAHFSAEVDLWPTHWLPPMLGPKGRTE